MEPSWRKKQLERNEQILKLVPLMLQKDEFRTPLHRLVVKYEDTMERRKMRRVMSGGSANDDETS